MTPRTVGLFGSYEPRPGSDLYELAYDIGAELARAGFVVLNGGYDGVMAASSKGARDAGGRTVGVTCPTVLIKRGAGLIHNPYLDEVVETRDLLERIRIMMHRSGGYVFLPGGTGTLSELGVIWEYVNKEFIEPRPLVMVGEFWKPTVRVIADARPGADRSVHHCRTAGQVAEVMTEHAIRPSAEPDV